MSSASGSGRVWTMVVIVAVVAGALGTFLFLNSPDITVETYQLVGIDRVPESRFLAHVGFIGFARWEDVPAEYSYVIWLNGELEWSNRFYDAVPKLPKVWLEDVDGKRIGRIFVKRTADGEYSDDAALLGIGITEEDLESAASGHLVIARNRQEIVRLPLANFAQMADLPDRSVVEFPAGSLAIEVDVDDRSARIYLSSLDRSEEPGAGDEGDLVVLIGQASFLPTGDEHMNDVWALLMPGHHIDYVSLDNRPAIVGPMAVKISGRIVYGTWVRETIHIDASVIPADASGQEEELAVQTQSHSFLGGTFTLDGPSARVPEVPRVWDGIRGDHHIDFTLNLSSSFTAEIAQFGGDAEKRLVLVSPLLYSYSGPGLTSTPGESTLRLFNLVELIDACSHTAIGFDIDVYSIIPIKSSDFDVKLKPSF